MHLSGTKVTSLEQRPVACSQLSGRVFQLIKPLVHAFTVQIPLPCALSV